MLRSYIRTMLEEKESLVRKAKFTINGNTGLLTWIIGNAIKAKKLKNAVETAEYLKSNGIIDFYTVSTHVSLYRNNLITIMHSAKPVQKNFPCKLNWDEIAVSDETATSLAAIEEMPMKLMSVREFIKLSNVLASIG